MCFNKFKNYIKQNYTYHFFKKKNERERERTLHGDAY